jgi:hypothetical protein
MSSEIGDSDPFERYRRPRAIETEAPQTNEAPRWIFSGLLALAFVLQIGTQINLWGQGLSTFSSLSLLVWKLAWLLELAAFVSTAVAFGFTIAGQGRRGVVFALAALGCSILAVLMFIFGDVTNEVPLLSSLKGEIFGLSTDSSGSTVFYPAVLFSGPLVWIAISSGLLVFRHAGEPG